MQDGESTGLIQANRQLVPCSIELRPKTLSPISRKLKLDQKADRCRLAHPDKIEEIWGPFPECPQSSSINDVTDQADDVQEGRFPTPIGPDQDLELIEILAHIAKTSVVESLNGTNHRHL